MLYCPSTSPVRMPLPATRPSNMACQSLSSDGSPNKRYSPTLSNIRQYFLPSNTRMPRPTCCRYFANDSVGLANWINSTSGQSKPSPNKSTLTNTCMLAVCANVLSLTSASESSLNVSHNGLVRPREAQQGLP